MMKMKEVNHTEQMLESKLQRTLGNPSGLATLSLFVCVLFSPLTLRTLDVREFKGKLLIDIREFYTDRSDGKKKPGKKGLCLSPAEWDSLKCAIPFIDRKIKKMS